MWWTVIMNIRSFIMEKAASNSWRQPVNGYLSSGSSIGIDWIQGKLYILVYIFSQPLSHCITLAWFFVSGKLKKVINCFKCKKYILPHSLRGEIWKAKHFQRYNLIFHMKESNVANTGRNAPLLFLFPLPEHSSSSAVVGIPDAPWAGILNESTTDCSQTELSATNLGNFSAQHKWYSFRVVKRKSPDLTF